MPSIQEILTAHLDNSQKLIEVLSVDTNDERDQEKYKEEYEGERTRRLKSVGMRPDKTITILNEDGTESGKTKTIYPAKLVFNFPEKLVNTATHFQFGGKMSVSSDENDEAIKELTRVWEKDLKMQSNLKALARTCMIETKAAILFYPQPIKEEELKKDGTIEVKTKELKLRSMVLDVDSGEFFPHFDDYGDMDAFIRRYNTPDVEGKIIEKAVIYMKDMILHFTRENGSWDHTGGEKNLAGKIPVVYVEQKLPEWEGVATLIDDFEVRLSRLSDTNDYFAEPLLKIYGNISKAPSKEEVGKVLEFEMKTDLDGKISHGDAEYATWDHIPEPIKLEMEAVKEGIFSMSSTPDLSFNNIKGIGTTSGVALRLMFMDAMIKREKKGEIFNDALNRAVSIVNAMIAKWVGVNTTAANLDKDNVTISFTDQLPDDLAEFVETLSIAAGGKPIISQETAASRNPLVSDPKEEVERLKGEGTPNESFEI